MKPLKIYGWQSHRLECAPAANGSQQTREIVAASSAAAAARAAGAKSPRSLFCFCETGNAREVEVASANPGVVFWRPINALDGAYKKAG